MSLGPFTIVVSSPLADPLAPVAALANSAVQPGDDIDVLEETSTAKIMTGDERTKLAGVATGATANATDANLKDRANHTGSQAISTVTGLQAALDGKATAAALISEQEAREALQEATEAAISEEVERAAAAENLIHVSPDVSSRPGDSPLSFTPSVAGGDAAELPKIDPSKVVVGFDGKVVQHVGAQTTVTAIYSPVEPGRIYGIRSAGRRNADPATPKAITFGLLWYDNEREALAGGDFGTAIAQPNDFAAAERRVYEATFSRDLEAGFTAPSGTRYARGFIETISGEVGFQSELIEIEDITEQVALENSLTLSNDRIEQAELVASSHAAALDDTATEVISARSIKNWTPAQTAGFTGWGLFDDSHVDDVVDGFALYLKIPANVASFDVQVISRPAAFTSTAAPGTLPEDIVHAVLPSVTFAPSTVPAVSHAASEEVSEVRIAFGRALHRSADLNYAMMLRARDGSNALVQLGRITSDATGLSVFGLGWTYGPSGILTKLTDGSADATAGYVFRRTPASPALSGLTRLTGSPRVDGLTVDLRGVMVRDLNGLRPLYAGRITVPPASSGSNFEHTDFDMQVGAVADYLAHTNISNVEVRLAGTATLLTPETDYHVDPSGRLYATGHAAALVDVTYDWANERIDLIAEVPESGTTILIEGTERVHTAHEDLYRAQVTAPTQRPLYHVRVVGDAIAEIIPVWDWLGTFSILHHNEIDAQVRQARDKLAAFRAKLMRGDGIIISGYNSSLVEMGGGSYVDASSFEPNRYGPNGATDLGGFIGGFYADAPSEADFRTDFFAAQTPVTLNGHARYRIGPIWRLIDAIITEYGYTFVADEIPGAREITYLNQGIGASTMAATAGNAGDPARLAKLIDPSSYGFRKPDLVVMDAGMNGTPSANFPAQLANVVDTITGAGINLLVYGPQLTNIESPTSPANRMTLPTWRSVHAQIRHVTMPRKAAYMPMDMIQGPGFEGYLGINAANCCRPNYLNHDGPYEQRKRGEFLSLAVL